MTTDRTTLPKPLISICVCTYRRPRQLEQLLQCLDHQATHGLFDLSIVVADNDASESARSVVKQWGDRLKVPIVYGVEPRQSIALARNASVAMARGEFLAFVDDDEEPSRDWLRNLYEVLIKYGADGVIGPVLPRFEENAPSWAVRSGVFQRPGFQTGEVLNWTAAGLGSVLIKREVLLSLDGPFRVQYGAGGEDQDLFRRAMLAGRKFVWSAEALCYEPVARERTKVLFQLRRALLRGKLSLRGPGGSRQGIIKSAIAFPIYVVALPVCLTMGLHVFVTQLVKSFDHLGKLLAACGIDVVGETYVTEASGRDANAMAAHCRGRRRRVQPDTTEPLQRKG